MAGRQPLVVHGNPAPGKVLGGDCVGAQMMLLAAPAGTCQYDLCMHGSEASTLISFCSYLKAESYFLQGGGLAGNQLLRTVQISLHQCVSQSWLYQKAYPDRIPSTELRAQTAALGIPVAAPPINPVIS